MAVMESASSGTDDVKTIAALLKSTAPDQEQIKAAYNALHLEIPDFGDSIWAWTPTDPTRSQDPKDERILRWLLSKFDAQEPAHDSVATSLLAYNLLYHLMLKLSFKVLLRQLQSVELLKAISAALQFTKYQLANDGATLSQRTPDRVVSGNKRNHDEAEQHGDVLKHANETLVGVSLFLLGLQKISIPHQRAGLHWEQLRNVLNLSTDRAAVMIESGLWCALGLADRKSIGSQPREESSLVQRLLVVWYMTLRDTPKQPNDSHHQARRAIARNFLLPALEFVRRTGDSGVKDFIVDHCLVPYRQFCAQNPQQLTETVVEMLSLMSPTSIKSLESDAPTLTQYHVEVFSQQVSDVLPLLIECVGSKVSPEQSSQRKLSEAWHAEIFQVIMKNLGVDLEGSSPKILSTAQLKTLADVLRAFQDIKFSPGPEKLSKIVRFYTVQPIDSFSYSPWRIADICLKMRPIIVCDDKEGHEYSKDVVLHIFDAINLADSRMLTQSGVSIEEIGALCGLLQSFYEALLMSRNTSVFASTWETSVVQSLQLASRPDKQGRIIKERYCLWDLDVVRASLKEVFSTAIGQAGLVNLFEQLVQRLWELSKTERNSIKFSALELMLYIVSDSSVQDDPIPPMKFKPDFFKMLVKHWLARQFYDDGWAVLDLTLFPKAYVDAMSGNEESTEEIQMLLTALHPSLLELAGPPPKNILDTPACYQCRILAFLVLTYLYRLQRFDNPLREDTSVPKRYSEALADLLSKVGTSEQPSSEFLPPSQLPHASYHVRDNVGLIWYVVEFTTKMPQIFAQMDRAGLLTFIKRFFKFIYYRWKEDSQPVSGTTQSPDPWSGLWKRLTSSTRLEEESEWNWVAKRTISDGILGDDKETFGLESTNSLKDFYHFSLLRLEELGAHTLSKADHGKVANQIMAKLQTKDNSEILSISLRLLRDMMLSPNRSMDLIAQPSCIWTLFSCLNETASLDDVNVSRTIASAIISHWNRPSEGCDETFKAFTAELNQRTREIDGQGVTLGESMLIASAMSVLNLHHSHRHDFHEDLQLAFLQCQFNELFQIQKSYKKPMKSKMRLFLLLDNISLVPASIYSQLNWEAPIVSKKDNVTGLSADRLLQYLADKLREGWLSSQFGLEPAEQDLECWSRIMRAKAKKEGELSLNTGHILLELNALTGSHLERKMFELVDDFKKLPVQGKVDVLRKLCSIDVSTLNLAFLCQLIGTPIFLDERQESLKKAFQQVLDCSIRDLEGLENHHFWDVRLGLIHAALSHHPWIVTQEHIDRVITLVALVTRILCGRRKDSSSQVHREDHLFQSLTFVLDIVFKNYRRKVGGRWHLVVDALKGLLRCLFIAYPNASIANTTQQLTLLQHDSRPIPERLVNDFSRLLSNICDPTHKALRSKSGNHHSRQILNDGSKAARAISGQHMQHFIAEFCSLQLQGKIEHRSAIMPGIYAIFDAMSQDVRKSLNESLDPQAALMFKNLYDDWKKFGRWEGN